MRREDQFLRDTLDACEDIATFLDGLDEDGFRGDEMLRSAVLLKLLVIGEAANQLGDAFPDEHPEIPWADIVGLRNLLIHAYFRVDWSIVWTTATREVPKLREQVRVILYEIDGEAD